MDYAAKQKKRKQEAIKTFFTTETFARRESPEQLGYYALLACIFNAKLTPDESIRMMGVPLYRFANQEEYR